LTLLVAVSLFIFFPTASLESINTLLEWGPLRFFGALVDAIFPLPASIFGGSDILQAAPTARAGSILLVWVPTIPLTAMFINAMWYVWGVLEYGRHLIAIPSERR
jgi:hypothetical protein